MCAHELNTGDHHAAAWTAVPHQGRVQLPNGTDIPASITSFTRVDERGAFFLMSTPSVWRDAGMTNDGLGLETMMVAVLLHEGSHVMQR